MLSLEEARDRILAALPAPVLESIPLGQAHGRILAVALQSPLDLPSFDNSAMDGFAVRAAETSDSSTEAPRTLQLLGEAAAGRVFEREVAPGSCVRVSTGSPLPRGSDAVIMQEDTRTEPSQPGTVQVLAPVAPWENVRFRGEDVKRGAALAGAGARIDAGLLALLAATGFSGVAVARQPVVGLLATGSELLEPGESPGPGRIHDSNRVMLAALLAGLAVPRSFPLVRDTREDTTAALRRACEECDIVVTTGGASVGGHDHVKDAIVELGGGLDFWRVSMKPGKPFLFGRWQGRFVFGLPGNPVSAFVTFLMLVRPALLRWQGVADCGLPSQPGTLTESLVNRADRRHFVRVIVDPRGNVRRAGTQASHILTSLAAAHGLVDLPPGASLPPGSNVEVLRWNA